jgi:hypothetical protein
VQYYIKSDINLQENNCVAKHLPKKQTVVPLPTLNTPLSKNSFLTRINPFQKGELVGFSST